MPGLAQRAAASTMRKNPVAQRAATRMPTVNPPTAPKAMAPTGNRPMGVSPPPIANPMPMSPMEAAGRAKAQSARGLPQQVARPNVEMQPGFRS
ncbi:MAG: hypothetical protein ACRC2H_10420, partial [Silanimonas sp.]